MMSPLNIVLVLGTLSSANVGAPAVDAVAVLKDLSARIEFGSKGEIIPVHLEHQRVHGDHLRVLQELDHLELIKGIKSLSSLDLSETRISTAGQQLIAQMPRLNWLRLPAATFASTLRDPSDPTLGPVPVWYGSLRGLEGYRKVQLRYVTDRHLTDLPKLAELRVLVLRGNPITDASMTFVGRLTKLQLLDLDETAVSDRALADLKALKSLRFLWLRKTRVTSKGLTLLPELPLLEALGVPGYYVEIQRSGDLAGLSVRVGVDPWAGHRPENFAPLTRMSNVQGFHLWQSTDDQPILTEEMRTLASMSELRRLKIYNWRISAAGKTQLAQMTKLEELDLKWTDFASQDLHHLQLLRQLRLLRIHGVEGRDIRPGVEGLAPLAGMPNLAALHLNGTEIGPDGVAGFRDVPNLRLLEIAWSGLTDEGVPALAELKTLESLDLRGNKLTDRAMPHLARLGNLHELHLDKTKITDVGLRHLAQLSELRVLTLPEAIGNAGMQHVALLKHLEELRIGGKVTDEGLGHLKGHAKLESLTLNNNITPAGLAHLRFLKSLRKLVIFGSGGFSDWEQGLRHLAALPHLEYLYLDDIECTSKLSEMFPNVQLEFFE